MTEITKALTRLFDSHRLVFWYDSARELRSSFESVNIDGVEKIEISNNEFGLKYRVLREEPKKKFLLYHEGPRPRREENWLLDLLLSHTEFRTDQVGVWLTELGLDIDFAPVIEEHRAFFTYATRRQSFVKKLPEKVSASSIKLTMLGVCAATQPRLESVLESLLEEVAAEKKSKFDLLGTCGLETHFWNLMEASFGYKSKKTSMKDFLLELFRSCFEMETGGSSSLSSSALIFLKRWRDNRHHLETYRKLASESAELLEMETVLLKMDYRALSHADPFDVIDQKILSEMAGEISARTLSHDACKEMVQQRMQCHFADIYSHHYKALHFASCFFHGLHTMDLSMESMSHGISRYAASWHTLDALYRKFYRHFRAAGRPDYQRPLADEIERRYINDYLLPQSSAWQACMDAATDWRAGITVRQDAFFKDYVNPFLEEGKKVFVIVSDALRFEVGMELQHRIIKEDRFAVTCTPLLSMLPSYTQLGMAALLPGKELEVLADAQAQVKKDGAATTGLEARAQILSNALDGKATALHAKDFLNMSKDESRGLLREHQLIYFYQNHIDAVGDKQVSEENLIEAVEETQDELMKVVKKLTNANATNILITADHGFLFQQGELEESDLLEVTAKGESIFHQDRRFVSGTGLSPQAGMMDRKAHEIGLSGEMDFQFAKGIGRLKKRGSGMRFVHGGASLQEVVIPLLHVVKKRSSDVSMVEVDIFQGASQVITTNQFSVTFYQREAATEKVKPRILRARMVSASDEVISEEQTILFDLDSDNARERELTKSFKLTTKAEAFNNQEVALRLEEPISGTTKYRLYKSANYTLRKSFQLDF